MTDLLPEAYMMQCENKLNHDQQSVDFLIVTALPEERNAVLRLLKDYEQVRISESLTCYMCSLSRSDGTASIEVAVTMLPQMGNVEAGIHTTHAIDELNPGCVLMVGIAAGIRNRVSLGDVIISTQVIYYEQAKQTPAGLEHRPLSVQADRSLLQAAQNCNVANWHDWFTVECSAQHEDSAASNDPQVHFGPLAVGDKVVASESSATALTQLHSKLIGIEMESYGVAMAAAIAPARPRFLAIRGVSDFADENKNDDWHGCAAARAAAFTIGFLHSGLVPPNSSPTAEMVAPSKHPRPLIAIRHLSMEYISPDTIISSLPPEFESCDITELFVDQTDLYTSGRFLDPLEAAKRQDNVGKKINALLKDHPDAMVVYFGIAHIPLLFRLGYHLTNKRKLHFFELNRYTGCWEYLEDGANGPKLTLDGLPRQVSREEGDVVMRISVSDMVPLEETGNIVSSPTASLHLQIHPPQRDAVVSEVQLLRYGAKFRRALDKVHELLPNRERIHVFYAGPVSLAVYFGQLISPTIDREVVVYNYTARDSPRYSWGLRITEETNSDGFVIKT